MSKFALHKIDAVKGRQTLFKLVKGNLCFLDEFERQASGNSQYLNELAMLYAYMEYVANGVSLPSTKFRDLTPKKEIVKEYELKTKHLRLYLIKNQNGKIVVMGGFKNNQAHDIPKFRKLKRAYLNDKE